MRYFREELGSEQAAENFLTRLERRAEWISEYPEAGRPTSKRDVRYSKVDKNHSIFYRIRANHIQMIFLWDWRRNPDQNPYLS